MRTFICLLTSLLNIFSWIAESFLHFGLGCTILVFKGKLKTPRIEPQSAAGLIEKFDIFLTGTFASHGHRELLARTCPWVSVSGRNLRGFRHRCREPSGASLDSSCTPNIKLVLSLAMYALLVEVGTGQLRAITTYNFGDIKSRLEIDGIASSVQNRVRQYAGLDLIGKPEKHAYQTVALKHDHCCLYECRCSGGREGDD
ncbi:hypothetical protein KCU61_g662, partial [Aureobasidium melanogenum]